jgi:hypothetical protein
MATARSPAQKRPESRLGVVGAHHRREVVVGPRRRVHDVDGLERAVGQRPQQGRSTGCGRIEAEAPALEGLLLHRAVEVPGAQVGVPVAHVAQEPSALGVDHAHEVVAGLPHRRRREPRVEADRLEQGRERRRRAVAVAADPGDGLVHHLVERLEPPRPPVVREQQQVVERHRHEVRRLQPGEAGGVVAHVGGAEPGEVGVDPAVVECGEPHDTLPAVRPTQRKITSSSAACSGKVQPGSDSFRPWMRAPESLTPTAR